MHDALLTEVFRTLGRRERSELTDWVGSPFVNRRPEVVRLCAYLCEYVPPAGRENAGPALSKRVVYSHVFPGQPPDDYDDRLLRHTMSYLFSAVRQWLAWREWTRDDNLNRLYLCRALRNKAGEKAFEKTFRALEKARETPRQGIDYHLVQYHVLFEKWEAEHRRGAREIDRLLSASASFGAFVAASTLRHGCAALDKAGSDFRPDNIFYLPETLAMVDRGMFADVPAVQIYFFCYRIMEEGRDSHFSALKAQLATHSDLFPSGEMRDVYMVAINYCIRRLNTGARAYVREAFDLYREGLQHSIMLDNGRIAKATYQNIMQLALALDEWSWARQFLEEYRQALAPGERRNAYQFNLALWHFRRKEYEPAQEILRKVEFRDVAYNLDARRMMVRIYYDRGEIAALDSLLHSFSAYLQRHRNIGYHRDLNLNFVRCVQRLILSEPGDGAALEKLRRKIVNEKFLAEREWLLEKTKT